jgi:hypothetical protein
MKRRWMELAAITTTLGAAAIVGACSSDLPTAIPSRPHNSTGSGGSGGGGGSDGTGGTVVPPGASAQQIYVQSVHPSLMDTCGNCHVSGIGTPYFLAADPNESYLIVKSLPGYVTDPSNSRLILKPEHSGGAAPAVTPQQADIITEWLEKELEENPIDPDDPPVGLTPLQQLEKFASCMSFDDWEAAGVSNLSNEQVIFQNNAVECDSCHDDGQDGTCISAESAVMFEMTKTMPYILKLAGVSLNPDGTFNDITRSNRWVEKCVEEQAIGNPHPPCVNDQINGEVINAINAFFDATYQRWADDLCETAVQPPPPAP